MQRIAKAIHGPVTELAEVIRTLAGDHARSLAMVGAVVTADFDPAQQTARSVLVVDAVDLEWMRRLGAQGARLGRLSLSAPRVLTQAHLESSRDAFPLELIEIQQFHEMVFGEDVFAPLSFDALHVRIQCERELKSLLINLGQGVLAAQDSERMIAAIEGEALEALLRTLRGVLWLKGERETLPADDVVQKLEALLSHPLPGVRAAASADCAHDWSEFQRFYRDVAFLCGAVNGL